MKTSFPLFLRLLLWFFINLAVLLIALFLTLRLQFGSQFKGFLPDTSHSQTQAMAEVLISDLATTPKDHWDSLLSHLGQAYHLDFGLYDRSCARVAGTPMDLPVEVRSVLMMTGPGLRPPPGAEPGPPPEGPPGGPDVEGSPPPPQAAGGGGARRLIPDFPQRVIRTEHPSTFWLLVHLPLNQLHVAGLEPAMLVGRTDHIGDSPLLFNPNPWIFLTLGMILFSALFWLPLTRNLTRAIAKMTQATEAIAEGNFDLQAPEKRADELGRLGLAINRMAARLKGFITGQRRFLGDVAHELCSPLARMEVALGILEEQSDEKTARYVTDVREEVTHMRNLAHELLSFSKAALGENRARLEPLRVAEVIEAAVRQENGGAGQVEVRVPDHLHLLAQPKLLCRAIANLLRNAIRYAGHAGPIVISAWEEEETVVIAVADQGPGVPPREIERVFDPFYRLDESRGAETGGAGLGLAIVKTCVEACRGQVTAFNRTPTGLEVQLRFPRPADAPPPATESAR